jgi:N-hydroxyarylamine O-acetyltransferase
LSNHPNSHFITGLIGAKTTPDRRYALRNHELAVHHLHGNTDRHTLGSVSALRSTLENIFRLNLTEIPEIDTTLQRLIVTK